MATDPFENLAPVPSLDSSGWLKDPAVKADALLCNYLQADHSQSTLMPGSVKSFQYTLQQNTADELQLQSEVRRELTELFDKYFEVVTVDVRVEVPQGPQYISDAILDIRIDIAVGAGGIMYSVGKLLTTRESKLEKVVDLNRIS